MFKKAYLEYLRETIKTLTPDGYTVKIVEELGVASGINPKFNVICYVKFGAATKQVNASDRINQPLIFSIFSEAENFKVAEQIFRLFFLTVSRTHSTLKIEEVNYDLWHSYSSPSMQTGFMQIGEYQRANIIMTGVVSYSKEKIIGVKYYLDDVEIQAVNPQSQYNTQATTPQTSGENTGKVLLEGANNSYTFTLLMDKSIVVKKLRDTSVLGNPYSGVLKIVYPDKTYTINVRATSVINVGDNNTGDNILTVALMPD
jgi:hypothetical protein